MNLARKSSNVCSQTCPHLQEHKQFVAIHKTKAKVLVSNKVSMAELFFFLHCRAHHYSSDGHEVGKTTTTSRHRGEPPKTKQTQKHKPKTNKNQTKPTKRLPKKARTGVKRCETCENATLKLSNVLLQEVVPNKVQRSVQRCSVSNYLLCIYHTSRSISKKVASSRSGLLSSI